ncbi:hypothetical protein [Mycobacterium sp. NPDC050041]|uniref:hypothetical protein n=1 Tax=Mycobacterium sp. NPDC050041 TaxID=3364293 RepID=UPI003C2E99FE
MSAPCRPIVGAEAIAARVIPERTLRRRYLQLYPGVYVPTGSEPSARERAEAAWLWSKRRGVVAGLSAAAMLGTKWIDGRQPAELVHDNRKTPPMLIVRSDVLLDDERVEVDRMAVTSPARTAFDIGRHTIHRVQAVQRLDALAAATRLDPAAVEGLAAAHPGVRGLRRLRAVLPLVDGGAESPQGTVARLALVDAGLPAPRTQVNVFDEWGTFVARLDLAYERVKVGIEYDGPQHWTDPAVRQRDIDKQFDLTALGWNVIRVSRDLLRYRRATYVLRVEEALRARGRPECDPHDGIGPKSS